MMSMWGLSVIVQFYNENTTQWWVPDMGGSKLPALNDLLAYWSIEFGDRVFKGEFKFGDHEMYYATFPEDGLLVSKYQRSCLSGDAGKIYLVLLQTTATEESGHVVGYGDSNCLDVSLLEKACYWMLNAILKYTSTSHLPTVSQYYEIQDWSLQVESEVPQRMEGNRLYSYLKVLIPLNVSASTNLYQP